jgi:catechol-2,3-dioxygenase
VPEGCHESDRSAIRRSRTLLDDLEKAGSFYAGVLGLQIAEEQEGHHAKFDSEKGFICLEKKGIESYPSKDKAVLFFEVGICQRPSLRSGETGW